MTRCSSSSSTRFVLGSKSEAAIDRFADGSRAAAALRARFDAPTLWDAFLRYLIDVYSRGSEARGDVRAARRSR